MREVVVTKQIYTYPELSEEAKESVKQWYLDDPDRANEYENICLSQLQDLFPAEPFPLKVQFSLTSCQGDGFNIYGKIDAEDVLNAVANNPERPEFKKFTDYFTKKEIRTISNYAKQCDSITLPYNQRYTYSCADRIWMHDWVYDLELMGYRDINTEVIRKFEIMLQSIFKALCNTYEKSGYQFFYEVDDEELEDICACNGWEFLKNGEYYTGE